MSETVNMAELKKTAPVATPATESVTKPIAQDPVRDQAAEAKPDENADGPQWVPQVAKDAWRTVADWGGRRRKGAIEVTPTFIVNNSSNFLGAAHVATEMLMFKAGTKGANLIDNPGNPINWVKEPVQKIAADVFTNSKSRDFSPMQLLRGNPIKNFHKYIMDTHEASHREVDRQISANRELVAAGKEAKKLSLGNPWQTRSTLAGLFVWSLSTIIPEHKEPDEEIERMATMRTLHPVQYIGERLKQAVWVPQWTSHKREMIGLGYIVIGICSMLGSWRNRGELKGNLEKDVALINKGLKQGYTFNSAYFATAVVSFLASFPLLFALDEKRAYSGYGTLSLLRLPFLPSSITSKIAKKEDGWQYYLAGKASFQGVDMMQSLIGGATKIVKPDGSIEIIDHEQLKKEAIKEAKHEKALIKEEKHHPKAHHGDQHQKPEHALVPATPTPTITNASTPERAMPKRVAALASRGDAANDAQMTVAANQR